MSGASHPNHLPMHRGPTPHMPPLPQREKRERDRGWENQSVRQPVQGVGASPVSVQAVAPQPHVPSNLGSQRKDPGDMRMNGGGYCGHAIACRAQITYV